jgi:hypothetical protein
MFPDDPSQPPRSADEATRTTEVELAVGETVRVGDVMFTVVEIADGEVHLKVDEIEAPDGSVAARFAAVAR